MYKYTYKDVIIDPEDPRVEIGAEYYFGDTPAEVLKFANDNGRGAILANADDEDNQGPFWFKDIGFTLSKGRPCIIRKKEPEKKYVPFDLNNEEDRVKLRGVWVREKDSGRELAVTAIYLDEKPPFVELNDNGFIAEDLLENYEFLDGTPCGKLVEKA